MALNLTSENSAHRQDAGHADVPTTVVPFRSTDETDASGEMQPVKAGPASGKEDLANMQSHANSPPQTQPAFINNKTQPTPPGYGPASGGDLSTKPAVMLSAGAVEQSSNVKIPGSTPLPDSGAQLASGQHPPGQDDSAPGGGLSTKPDVVPPGVATNQSQTTSESLSNVQNSKSTTLPGPDVQLASDQRPLTQENGLGISSDSVPSKMATTGPLDAVATSTPSIANEVSANLAAQTQCNPAETDQQPSDRQDRQPTTAQALAVLANPAGAAKPDEDEEDEVVADMERNNQLLFDIYQDGAAGEMVVKQTLLEIFDEVPAKSDLPKRNVKEHDKTIRERMVDAVEIEPVTWHRLAGTIIETADGEVISNPLSSRFAIVNSAAAEQWLFAWRSYCKMDITCCLLIDTDTVIDIAKIYGPDQEAKWLAEEEEFINSLPQGLVARTIGRPDKESRFKFDWQVVRCMFRGCLELLREESEADCHKTFKVGILDKVVLGQRREATGEKVPMVHPCLMDRFPDLDFGHPFRRLKSSKGKHVWVRVRSKVWLSKCKLSLFE